MEILNVFFPIFGAEHQNENQYLLLQFFFYNLKEPLH